MTLKNGFSKFVICFISQQIKRSKHGLFVFPPKKILIWRRHATCSFNIYVLIGLQQNLQRFRYLPNSLCSSSLPTYCSLQIGKVQNFHLWRGRLNSFVTCQIRYVRVRYQHTARCKLAKSKTFTFGEAGLTVSLLTKFAMFDFLSYILLAANWQNPKLSPLKGQA